MEAERGIRLVTAPKRNGTRWLVRLDEPSAARYAACVVPVVPAVEAGLSAAAVANRVAGVGSDPPRIVLEPWRIARDRFHRAVSELAAPSEKVVVADVRSCYPSVRPEAVHLSLRRLGCDRGDIARVLDGLRRFEAVGVVGLPIGPEPSAVLANAVLALLDDALETAGYRHVRWVDDVLVFLDRRQGAADVLNLMRRSLGAVELGLAEEKTRIASRPTDRDRDLLQHASPTGNACGPAGG